MSSTLSSAASLSSNFEPIFATALSEYAKHTGIDLTTHPSVQALQNCSSADAILDVLGDKAKQIRAYRDENRKLINYLRPVMQVLHTVSGNLGETARMVPFQPTKAILVGVDVLLTAAVGVSTSYDALVDLFECIGNFLNCLRIYTEIPFSRSMSGIMTQIKVEVLSVLSLATKQIKQERLIRFANKLLGESEIEDVLNRLDRLTLDEARMTGTETLQIIHGLVSNMKLVMGDRPRSMDGIWHALVTIQELTGEINKMKRHHLQKDIRSWLCPPDPSTNHDIARGIQHDGTAGWFTQGSMFEEWKATGSLLWIHGKPGSGKSILCSTIIQEIKTKCDRGLALLGYYYFDFRDIAKQGIRGLLTSLLSQFCAKSDPCCQILSNLYSENDAGLQPPDNKVLAECLKEILGLPHAPMRYIILDAIDECPNTSGRPTAREEVLVLVEELVCLNLPNLRICVTSRPEVDIRNFLEPLTPLHMSLHDQSGQKRDILHYISNVVHSDRKMRRWRLEDKQLVIETLSERADGMFRWVQCQLHILRRCLPSAIRQALVELPESLDETYAQILLGLERGKQRFAHQLFQCLTVAVRPLRVDELAGLVAIRFDDDGQVPQYREGWQSENAQEAVLSPCSSLIAVVNVDGSLVVQFSHFSVKEFLTSDRLANSTKDLSFYYVTSHAAHTFLAEASLGVLLHLGDRIDKHTIKCFPFSLYAAQHWVDHISFGNASSSIQGAMGRLFDMDEPSFAAWIWLYDIDYPSRKHMFEDRPPRPEATPLYYATLCGFYDLAERLIFAHPEDVNANGGRCRTPLHAALDKGHANIAILLAKCGADVESRGIYHHTPLHLSAHHGSTDTAQLLIECGADPNAENVGRETPLIVASNNGRLETARLLLEHAVDANKADSSGWTSLHVASLNGHIDVMKLLLNHGANVNAENDIGDTPLHIASSHGKIVVIKVLLEYGANMGARDTQGRTPLHDTAESGYSEVVQLLLDHGADANAQDGDGWTALHLATYHGHAHVGKVLLRHGGHWYVEDNQGNTPLEIALESDHNKIVQLMLKRDW